MSDSFYAKTKKKTYKIIFTATAISLMLTGISSLPLLIKNLFKKGQQIAQVNNHFHVSKEEYLRSVTMVQQEKEAYANQFGSMAEGIFTILGLNGRPEEIALKRLINEKLLLSAAQTMNLVLNPRYVAEILGDKRTSYTIFGEAIPQALFDRQKGLDQEKLKVFLRRQGLRIPQFEDFIDLTLKRKLLLEIAGNSYVATKAMLKELETRKFRVKKFVVTQISYADFMLKEKEAASEEKIKKFYEQMNTKSQAYWEPERRSGSVWIFKQKGYDIGQPKEQLSEGFEKRFMRDTQGVVNSPEGVLGSFAQQRNATQKALIKNKMEQGSENPIIQHLFMASRGKRVAFVHEDVGYILELGEIHPGSPIVFDAIKDRVKEDFDREQIKKAIDEKLQSGENLEKVAKTSQLIWAPGLESEELKKLKDAGVPLERLDRMFIPGQKIVLMVDKAGYRIELIELGNLDTKAYEKDALKEQIAQYNDGMNRMEQEFVASLHEHAKIYINAEAIKE